MKAVYCGNCGQRNDDYRRSIFALFTEVFTSIFGFESRIWRTWLSLIIRPGKVAREYADGARTKWSSPVRVYLVMSILLFGFMGLTQTQIFSIDMNIKVKDGVTKPTAELVDEDYTLTLPKMHYFKTQKQVAAFHDERELRIIEKAINAEGFVVNIGDFDNALDNQEVEAANKILSSENQQANKNMMINLIRNPEQLNSVIQKWFPKLIFLMMPFTMLLGAIFIRGRPNALLFDHLVHAAYIHAFAYLLLLIGIILNRYMPFLRMELVFMVAMLIYLPLSLKAMFKRGWFKTLLTSYGVGMIYLLTITITMTLLVAFSVISLTQPS